VRAGLAWYQNTFLQSRDAMQTHDWRKIATPTEARQIAAAA